MAIVDPQLLKEFELRVASELTVSSVADLADFPCRTHQEFVEAYRASRIEVAGNVWPAVEVLSHRSARRLWLAENHLPLVAALAFAIAAAFLRDMSIAVCTLPLLALYIFAAGRLTFIFQTLPMLIICGVCFVKGNAWHSMPLQVSSVVSLIGLVLLSASRAWPSMLVEEAILASEPVLLWMVSQKLIAVYGVPQRREDCDKLDKGSSK